MKQTLLVAMSNQKGGVGKSSVTVLLASYLHYVKEKNVAIVDCDTLQHSVSHMRKRDMQTVEKTDEYKQLMMAQWEKIKKKAYTIVDSTPAEARIKISELLESNPDLDIILVDLPGSLSSEGVFKTIINMDYVLTPIVADRIVMQSTMSFATAVLDYLKGKQDIPLKDFLFFWNKVDRRASTEVYDTYQKIMERLNLKVLKTVLPESRRFDKELSMKGKPFFRSTLFPPPQKILKGSCIDELVDELCEIIKL
ncbi:ParA family protein [Bacteroides sp. 51]|uniref:ParA family protein n=1 Tax=Bacteroides sp. 51 TaxID=2302938 RepID=UPI0013D1CE46|nr:ParA family protein [Bacteroides sp. 51]NDV81547.1 ParA family protein [Bacteroides sp. 51]